MIELRKNLLTLHYGKEAYGVVIGQICYLTVNDLDIAISINVPWSGVVLLLLQVPSQKS